MKSERGAGRGRKAAAREKGRRIGKNRRMSTVNTVALKMGDGERGQTPAQQRLRMRR
jgi:hypothetical protein